MKMVLRLEGCGRFAEESVLELPERGVCLIQGPSGVGKSTLLEAIAFALGFNSRPATRLASRSGHPLRVDLAFETEAGAWGVTRTSKGPKVRFSDGPVRGNATVQEQKIQEALRLPLEVIRTLAFRRQRRRSAFLTMSDEKKKIFLAGPAGLQDLEARLKEGRRRLTTCRAVRDAASASLVASRRALETVGDPGAEMQRLTAQLEGATRAASAAGEAWQIRRLEAERAAEERRGAFELVLASAAANKRAAREAADRALAALPLPVVSTETPELDAAAQEAAAGLARVRAAIRHLEQEDRAALAAHARARREAEAVARRGTIAAERRQACVRDIVRAADDIGTLERQLAALSSAVCPTCDRDWPEGAARQQQQYQAKLARKQEDLVRLRQQEAAYRDEIAACPSIEAWDEAHPAPKPAENLPQLRAAETVLVQREAEIGATRAAARAHAEAVLSEIRAKRDGVQAELKAEHLRIDADVADIEAKLRAAAQADDEEVRHLQNVAVSASHELERVRGAIGSVRQQQEAFARLQASHQEAEQAAQAAETKLAEEEDALEAVRAFAGAYFQDLLNAAADQTNALLGAIPNVRQYVFGFKTQVGGEDDELRQTIKPTLTIDGYEAVGDDEIGDDVSGGQGSAVDLAVDLGILTVLEERYKARAPLLIIDEAFEGLDPPSREACMQILQAFAVDRPVLMVDHMAETHGLADHKIEVVASGGGSLARRTA